MNEQCPLSFPSSSLLSPQVSPPNHTSPACRDHVPVSPQGAVYSNIEDLLGEKEDKAGCNEGWSIQTPQ